jgi:hypothetical protein
VGGVAGVEVTSTQEIAFLEQTLQSYYPDSGGVPNCRSKLNLRI